LFPINCTPGPLSSNLIKTEKAVPNKPENNAKIKYKVPISFALVERNHLSVPTDISDFKGIPESRRVFFSTCVSSSFWLAKNKKLNKK
jgi:hypothetical protein